MPEGNFRPILNTDIPHDSTLMMPKIWKLEQTGRKKGKKRMKRLKDTRRKRGNYIRRYEGGRKEEEGRSKG